MVVELGGKLKEDQLVYRVNQILMRVANAFVCRKNLLLLELELS